MKNENGKAVYYQGGRTAWTNKKTESKKMTKEEADKLVEHLWHVNQTEAVAISI